MFNKSLSQVTFADVEQFCATFAEGVRVEYKSAMIDSIPKVVSAFANTLGGIVVIGVEADKVSNKVVSVNGIDRQAGIEEQIISASLNGIYPSVIPEIKILDVPNKKDKIIVVIKVHESVEAPHAIQNSTKVYIRNGSVSQPSELAEVERIEYLLKRRGEPEKRKLELIDRASRRLRQQLQQESIKKPFLQISITPLFPYQPLITLGALKGYCDGIALGSTIGGFNLSNAKRVTDGVCKFDKTAATFDYVEINHYGLLYFAESVHKAPSNRINVGQNNNDQLYLRFFHFVLPVAKALMLAESFYAACNYSGNFEIKFELYNITNEKLIFDEQSIGFYEDYKSLDEKTSSDMIAVTEDISQNLVGIITTLMQKVLWVFNCPVEDPKPVVEKILVSNHLITKTA